MKNVQYRLKIPSIEKENEFEEFIFNKPDEIAEKLKISITTVYRLINGSFKYSHVEKKHLQGIVIEKIIQPLKHPRRVKKTEREIKKETIDFRKTLLETLKVEVAK